MSDSSNLKILAERLEVPLEQLIGLQKVHENDLDDVISLIVKRMEFRERQDNTHYPYMYIETSNVVYKTHIKE